MATQTTGGGSTTSFSNAPQAQGDAYAWTEDQLKSSSLYNSSTNTITLDVMANDLGGKAKTLWSIDDGGSNFMTELLQSNITTSWERTAEGNWMRISSGKIEYRIDDGSNSPDNARSVDSLAGGEHIQDSFYYSIRLGNGTLSYAKVTLDITGQNDVSTFGGTYEGSVVEAGGTNNSDPGSPTTAGTLHVYDADFNQNHFQAPLEAALEGTYGKFSFDASTGAWIYALDNARLATQALPAGQQVTDTLTVWSADGTASQDIVVTITGTNDAPAVSGAVSDGATEGGTPVTLNALANATDVDDGTTLQVVNVPVTLPAGVSYDAATHAFTLDPKHAAYDHLAAGQPTTVTVTYAVSDGIATTPASVTWIVTGTNDAPAVSGAVSDGATEGGTPVTLNALANATDVDDGTALQVVNVPAQLPDGVSYDAATHAFTLDPKHAAYDHLAAGQPTTVTVTYAVSDGIATTPASVTWIVTGTNDAPAVSGAVSDGAAEGGTPVTLNALANASDVDDGTALQVVNVPVTLPDGVSYDAATHAFTLDPKHAAYDHLAAGQPTTVTVTYAVSDGIASTPASVTWIVTGTNDAPAVSGAVSDGATEGGTPVTLNALANASDVDDGTALQVVNVPVTLPDGVSYDAATHAFTLDPKHAAYDHLAAGQPTTVTVTYAVSDGIASTPASVTWIVTGTNDAPAVSGAVSDGATEGGTPVTLNALANATDVDDGTALQVVNVPAQLPDGVSYDAATHAFTLDPKHAAYDHLAAGQPTTVTVTYAVSDGIATTPASVTWIVTGTNDAPAVSGAVSDGAAEGGTPVTLNALANASDVDDGTALQVVNVPVTLPDGVSYDAATHAFTLDPKHAAYDHLAAGQPTTVTVTYAVSDGIATTPASVTWIVTGTNDAPAVSGAVSDGATEGGTPVTLNALANATDVDDGTALQVVNVPAQLPDGVSYDAATHAFTLDPKHAAYDHLAAGQPTTVTVTYAVSDGIATTPASVTWIVTGTNDAPAVSGAVSDGAAEGGTPVTLNALANASDVDDGTALQVVNVPVTLPDGVSYDAATHAFTLDPKHAAYDHLAAGQPTTVTVTYAVSDGIASTPASVTWIVTGTNDAPAVSGAVSDGAAEGGTPVTLNALANASDVDDGTALQVVNVPVTLPDGVSYDAATHAFTLDPKHAAYDHLAAGQPTTVTVTYAVSDGIASTPASVTWIVTGTNDAPAVSGAVTLAAIAEDSGARLITQAELRANASDIDGDSLTATNLLIATGNGSLVANANGSWTYTPAANDDTGVSFSYTITDGHGGSVAGTASLDITPVNDAPTNTVPGAQTVNSNTASAINGVAVTDVDSANVSTTVSVGHGKLTVGTGGGVTVSNNATATVTISGTLTQVNAALAALSYVSDTNYGGTDTLTVTTSDGFLSDTDTVGLTVNPPPNAAPVASNDVIVISTGTSVFLSAAWLLNNDTDADGDSLSISGAGIGSLPSGWTVMSVTAGGVITGFNVSTGNINQAATLAYTVSDGQGHTSTAQFTIQTPSMASTGNDNDINLDSLSYNYSYIDGKNHEDTLTANRTLSGTQGNDVFVGGNGDDTLDAGAGNNILTGGIGDDTFVFRNFGSTANHVTDFESGTDSTTVDTLRFDVGTGAGEFSAGNNNPTVENFKAGNNAAINFAGTEVAVKTDGSVTNASVQGTINGYGNITTGAFFVFHNTDLGHAAVYYDPNPAVAGGAVLVAELDNVTLLGNLGTLNAGDFQFV
ncbi:cadherin-like domain-containing protein (plasmid) [Sinorhizobium chiapasense]|uniref:cadherin-like domain-containing protein n=1 Tax=Sinorhizobium chiapasense TaxID=501572 RepID=UPI002FE0054D